MATLLDNAVYYLKQSDHLIGFPLVIAGLSLMLFGWRMWKVCVALAFGVLGAGITAYALDGMDYQWSIAGAIGLAVGLISAWPVQISVALLGGLLGAGLVVYTLSGFYLEEAVVYGLAGVAMIACTAYAFINRQRVVIFVTAFLGAVLLIAGLTAWVMAMPGLYSTLESLAQTSSIVLPFLLLVPTVMSAFYQVAEVHRLHIDL